MPIRLDSQVPRFRRNNSAPSSTPSARPPPTSRRPSAPSSPTWSRAATQALVELTNKFDRVDIDRGRPARDRGRDRRGARRLRPARRSTRCTLAQAADRGLSPAAGAHERPLHRCARRRARPSLDRDRGGRALRAGRHRGLSVVGADERGAGQGRGRAAHRDGGAGAGRQARAAGAGGGEDRRHRRGLSRRRRAGGGGARLRHRRPSSRSRRSSGPATPMWRRPSGWCSARSAST